jgi:phosphosulfolactate synthase (CoM biosynthesis protein A)
LEFVAEESSLDLVVSKHISLIYVVFQTSNQELFIQGILLLPGSHIWIFSVVFAEVLHIESLRSGRIMQKKLF